MYLRTFPEKSSLIDRPRYRLLVSRLHQAGPRPVGEFIARLHRLYPELPIMDLLESYASVDIEALKRMGADRWPPAVFAVPDTVRSGRASWGEILRATLRPSGGDDAA